MGSSHSHQAAHNNIFTPTATSCPPTAGTGYDTIPSNSETTDSVEICERIIEARPTDEDSTTTTNCLTIILPRTTESPPPPHSHPQKPSSKSQNTPPTNNSTPHSPNHPFNFLPPHTPDHGFDFLPPLTQFCILSLTLSFLIMFFAGLLVMMVVDFLGEMVERIGFMLILVGIVFVGAGVAVAMEMRHRRLMRGLREDHERWVRCFKDDDQRRMSRLNEGRGDRMGEDVGMEDEGGWKDVGGVVDEGEDESEQMGARNQ